MTAAQVSRAPTDGAWISLFANAVVWPGVGTLFLRRWLLGGAQVLFALVGFGLALSDVPFSEAFGLGVLVGAFVWSVATALNAICSQSHGQ